MWYILFKLLKRTACRFKIASQWYSYYLVRNIRKYYFTFYAKFFFYLKRVQLMKKLLRSNKSVSIYKVLKQICWPSDESLRKAGPFKIVKQYSLVFALTLSVTLFVTHSVTSIVTQRVSCGCFSIHKNNTKTSR